MSQTSPNLALPFLQPSQAQKHVTHNEALRRLDIVVQLHLQQIGATVPPAEAEEGEVHGVGAGAINAWAGQDGMLAAWLDASWHFLAPQAGWRAWDAAAEQLVVWTGTAWTAPRPDLDNLDGVGIGTSADNINRLAVQVPATLLSHDGQGHQLKVNKAAESATASLLFQSDWTGFAEMGLTGQNMFSVKVSEDGSSWTEALRLDGATGHMTGNAVQADATDTPAGTYRYLSTTPGTAGFPDALNSSNGVIRIERYNETLLRQTAWRNNFVGGLWTREHFADAWGTWRHVYDQATILGTVSETAGQPTGAVIERGSSADGEYVRFADGT